MYSENRVTFDSTLNEGFLVYNADGTIQSFRPSKKGLFFSDVKMMLHTHLFTQ